MTHVKPRLARFAAFFLAGALVIAPLSANAAPTSAVPGDDRAAASYRAKNEDEAAKEAERAAMEAACEEEQAAEKVPDDDKKDKKDKSSKKDKAAEQAACEEDESSKKDKSSKDDKKDKSADEHPVGAVTGPGGASPSVAPVGATPAEGEVSIDEVVVPTPLSAAMELFDQPAVASNSIPEPVAPPMGMASGRLARELAPVLPPLLADAVVAPIVVIEALIDAMAASGQALVIPLLAGATGFIAPRVRRKHLLGEALGENPEPDPSNEPKVFFFGW